MPVRKLEEDGTWFHPARLPLGNAWHGHCGAAGHELAELSLDQLRECNLGYALACPRLPQERVCDAVRFSVARDTGSKLLLWFVCEKNHQPAACGTLEYEQPLGPWISPHSNPLIQRMAECFLESYLNRKTRSVAAEFTSSPHL